MERLAAIVPDAYATKTQLRTLQRQVKQWRAEKAKDLILGRLGQTKGIPESTVPTSPSRSVQEETSTQLQ